MRNDNRYMLEIDCPVHIGCGEEFMGTNFRLDRSAKEIVVFDPMVFYAELDGEDREKFLTLCKQGTSESLTQIFRFIDQTRTEGQRIRVCEDFIAHYTSVINGGSFNFFEIARTVFIPNDERPYLPGSSIKGALRTGYLNGLVKRSPKIHQKDKETLENRLLDYRTVEEDPFRLVQVSDFMPVGEVKTKLLYVVNRKKNSDKATKGIPTIMEVILPGNRFMGTISVLGNPYKGSPILKPISHSDLLPFASEFYSNENKREYEEVKNISTAGFKYPSSVKFPLRIGRHSGAESMTIEGYRDIKINLGRGKPAAFMDHATTIWLASEKKADPVNKHLTPMGWVHLSPMDGDDEKKLQQEDEAYCALARTEVANRMRRLEEQKNLLKEQHLQQSIEQKIREDRQKELEAEQVRKTKEAEEWKHRLETMTPFEKDLALLCRIDTPEQEVILIYQRLKDYSPTEQHDLAEQLKSIWIRWKKWEGGQSKKQEEKIAAIKAILGDL